MSDYDYTRAFANGYWNVDTLALAKEIKVGIPSKPVQVKAAGTDVKAIFGEDLTAPEIVMLDGIVVAHKATQTGALLLARVKCDKCAAIDARTTELRATGWEYPTSSGDYYSLSTDAESKLNAAFARRADGDFPYPLRLPTVDNTSLLSLVNAAAIDAAHKQMFTAVNALVESGIAIKAQVVAAANVAAVLAITDPR